MTAAGIPALLEPIQNRLNAATPGPWHWRNTSDVYLMGAKTRVVMGFARMGMQGAQPQFVNKDGLFIDAGKENLHAIPDAAFIAAAPTDQARLLAAVQAVVVIHKPVKIYDECDCPDGTHPEDYEYIDCQDYVGCDNSMTGIGCDECCVDAWDSLTQECGENHTHVKDPDKRCPTVAAVVAALDG